MVESPITSLENVLSHIETQCNIAAGSATKLTKTLQLLSKAAHAGSLRELAKTSAVIDSLVTAATGDALSARQSAEMNFQDYIGSSAYTHEISSLARSLALDGVTATDRRIFSNPIIAIVEPQSLTIRVGKRRWANLRPTSVIKALQQARRQAKSTNVSSILQATHRAYDLLTRASYGQIVPLEAVYQILTLLPGSSRTYSLDDFLTDIVNIDDTGPHVVNTKRLELYADSGAKAGKGHRLTRRDGREKIYFGVAFE